MNILTRQKVKLVTLLFLLSTSTIDAMDDKTEKTYVTPHLKEDSEDDGETVAMAFSDNENKPFKVFHPVQHIPEGEDHLSHDHKINPRASTLILEDIEKEEDQPACLVRAWRVPPSRPLSVLCSSPYHSKETERVTNEHLKQETDGIKERLDALSSRVTQAIRASSPTRGQPFPYNIARWSTDAPSLSSVGESSSSGRWDSAQHLSLTPQHFRNSRDDTRNHVRIVSPTIASDPLLQPVTPAPPPPTPSTLSRICSRLKSCTTSARMHLFLPVICILQLINLSLILVFLSRHNDSPPLDANTPAGIALPLPTIFPINISSLLTS